MTDSEFLARASRFSGWVKWSSGMGEVLSRALVVSGLLTFLVGSGLFTRLAVSIPSVALVRSGLLTRTAVSGISGDVTRSGFLIDLFDSGLLGGLSVWGLFDNKSGSWLFAVRNGSGLLVAFGALGLWGPCLESFRSACFAGFLDD